MLAPDDLVAGLAAVVQGGGRALAGLGEPLGELPAGRDAEMSAGRRQPVVQHRAAHVPRRAWLPGRPDGVAEEDAELLDGALGPEPARGLVRRCPVDGYRGTLERRDPIDDPVRDQVADPAAGQDAERVQAGGDEVSV